MGTFSGCYLDDDNNTSNVESNLTDEVNETEDPDTGATQFSFDIQSVLAQSEDDEPLEITDTLDESTTFDSLL